MAPFVARMLRCGPFAVQPIGRGDDQQPHVAPVFREKANGLDRFRRQLALNFANQRMDMTGNVSSFADLRYDGAYAWGEVSTRLSWRDVDHEMNFLADKGVVAVLDPRLATARYAGYLRASLPPFWETTNPEVVRKALTRIRDSRP